MRTNIPQQMLSETDTSTQAEFCLSETGMAESRPAKFARASPASRVWPGRVRTQSNALWDRHPMRGDSTTLRNYVMRGVHPKRGETHQDVCF